LVVVVVVDLTVALAVVAVRSDITRRNHCLEFHPLIFGLAQVEAVESGVVQDLVAVVLQPLNGVEQLNIVQMVVVVLAAGVTLAHQVDPVDPVVPAVTRIAMDRQVDLALIQFANAALLQPVRCHLIQSLAHQLTTAVAVAAVLGRMTAEVPRS
jgi:hypothetical protein